MVVEIVSDWVTFPLNNSLAVYLVRWDQMVLQLACCVENLQHSDLCWCRRCRANVTPVYFHALVLKCRIFILWMCPSLTFRLFVWFVHSCGRPGPAGPGSVTVFGRCVSWSEFRFRKLILNCSRWFRCISLVLSVFLLLRCYIVIFPLYFSSDTAHHIPLSLRCWLCRYRVHGEYCFDFRFFFFNRSELTTRPQSS